MLFTYTAVIKVSRKDKSKHNILSTSEKSSMNEEFSAGLKSIMTVKVGEGKAAREKQDLISKD